MIMSDNGAELFPTERKGKDKLVRLLLLIAGAYSEAHWQPLCRAVSVTSPTVVSFAS
jgi:hypothetical protein